MHRDLRSFLGGSGHEPEGSAGNVPGYREIAGAEFLGSLKGDPAAAIGISCPKVELHAELLKHPLCVVPAGGRLHDAGLAFGGEAGQKDGAFDLCAGHGHLIGERCEGAALNNEGGLAVATLGGEAGAHFGQRLDDAAHGALGERGVAGHPRANRVGGDDAREEAHRGAGVPAVDIAGRLGETAARSLDDEGSRAGMFDLGT